VRAKGEWDRRYEGMRVGTRARARMCVRVWERVYGSESQF